MDEARSGSNLQDGGEAIVQAFRSLGIDYVMASPGSEWSAVWEAFANQQLTNKPGPTYLSCAHETLAVDMAIGYTLITGRMQVVMLHTGVGLLQGTLGLEAAQRGNIPMVVMSGESTSFGDDPAMDPGFQWQAILSTVGSPVRFAEPLVKYANQTGSVATLHQQIVMAGELAQRTPPGPAYLCVPIEVMRSPWTQPDELREAPPAPKLAPMADDVAAIAEMLRAAKNPLIITEEAGRDPAGYAALVELAETLAIPVIDSRWAFYANFPKEHPLYAGAGLPPILNEADLIVMLACRAPWYPPSATPKQARYVAIHDIPFKDHMVYQPVSAERFLEGDIPTALTMLTEALKSGPLDETAIAARRAEVKKVHDAHFAKVAAERAEAAQQAAIEPIHLAALLSELAPEGTIFVDELITHRRFTSTHLINRGPQSYFRAHGGLGNGLGTALGMKLAAPERPVVTLLGDGTFMYNPVVQSLAFAQHQGLPTLTVIFNNHGYNAMKLDHQGYYPEGVAAQTGNWLGHPVTEFDYAELAKPHGGWGRTVTTPAELAAALPEAFEAIAGGRLAILNVHLAR
ncbi:MAG: thiamine pyrophosphate-dependent enzyme [Alphaproteobacteria bacterium]